MASSPPDLRASSIRTPLLRALRRHLLGSQRAMELMSIWISPSFARAESRFPPHYRPS